MSPQKILQELTKTLNLYDYYATFLEHAVVINWRQENVDYGNKVLNFPESLIHPPYIRSIKIKFKEIMNDDFNIYNLRESEKNVISISSLINKDNIQFHLPLMNLHLEEREHLDTIVSFIKQTTSNMSGFLLETNRYYHFYGKKLLTDHEWLQFNAQFLMPTILVSPRYVGHSLYQGYNTLRMTNSSEIKTIEPFCVKIF